MRTLRDMIQIVLLGVGAATVYGAAHRLITVLLAPEYFAFRGVPYILTMELTLTLRPAFVVLDYATWSARFALLVAVPLACIAQIGSLPVVHARQFVGPILLSMLILAGVSILASAVAFALALAGVISLQGILALQPPPGGDPAFLATSWSHIVSSFGGAVVWIFLWIYAWRARWQERDVESTVPLTDPVRASWDLTALRLLTWTGGVSLISPGLFILLIGTLYRLGLLTVP